MRKEQLEEFHAFATGELPGLRRLAYALTSDWHRADDAVQSTLEKALIHWRKVRDADNSSAYVRTVLVRVIVSEARKPNRQREVYTAEPPETPTRDGAEVTGERLDLARALEVLTHKQRAVVVLRFLEDRTVGEVASIMGIGEGTVKRQCHDAVRRLRRELADSNPHWSEPRDGRGSQPGTRGVVGGV